MLELDYVSSARPPKHAQPIRDHDLKHLCQRFKLLPRQVRKLREHEAGRGDMDKIVFKRYVGPWPGKIWQRNPTSVVPSAP